MKRRQLYIGISVVVLLFIVALLGWAIFIGKQQEDLQRDTTDLGYFGGQGGSSSDGGLFGGIFNDDGDTTTDAEVHTPTLRQLYNLPIAGYVKKQANAVRFVDRATGHIFEKELPDGASTRVDQTTVPKVYRAIFTKDGNEVVRQYIDDKGAVVNVYSDLLNDASENISFDQYILDMAVSPERDRLAVLERTNLGSRIVITSPTGEVLREIFNSNLRNWTIQWEQDTLLLTQKPSGDLPGSSFLFQEPFGVPQLTLQQKSGLVTNLSPDGKALIFSTTGESGRPNLFVKDLTTGSETALNLAGLADKCTWHPTDHTTIYCALPNALPQATYPDAWYQGDIHFDDSLWEINITTGSVAHVYSPSSSNGVTLDMSNLRFAAAGDILFFVNKTDLTFWSIEFLVNVATE